MKKLLVLLLAAFIAFSFASCDNSTPTPENPAVNAPAVNTEERFATMDDNEKIQFVSLIDGTASMSEEYKKLWAELSQKMMKNPNKHQTISNEAKTITMTGIYNTSKPEMNMTVTYDGLVIDGLTFWGQTKLMSSPSGSSSTASYTVRVEEASVGLEVGDVFSYVSESLSNSTGGSTTYTLNGQKLPTQEY